MQPITTTFASRAAADHAAAKIARAARGKLVISVIAAGRRYAVVVTL